MHVNRPSLQILPPLTPNAGNGTADAADADDLKGQVAIGAADVRPGRATDPTPAANASPQATAEASVKLDLSHSERARAAVTYGPDGIFAGKSAVEVATTPAERFVASAVEVMRAYEQERAPAASSPLERLKQAVASRFSAMA